jgi:protein-S-isoprenylcysteine O-methyltransferase Ste14
VAKYVAVAFGVYFLLFMLDQQIIALLRGARNLPPQARIPSYWLTLVSRLMLLVFVAGFPWTIAATKHQMVRTSPMIIGGAIVLAGLILSGWAQWALGPNWVGGVGSIGLHKNHQYVTTGPYRYVRHPMYSGMILSSVGLGVFAWNLLFLADMLVFASAYAIRSYGEDKILAGKFRKAYPAHVRRTGRFLPWPKGRSIPTRKSLPLFHRLTA